MEQIKLIRDTFTQIYWSLLLQGIAFVVLAILIVLYPALLIALAAVMFLLLGVILISLAIRIHMVWKKIPDFLK